MVMLRRACILVIHSSPEMFEDSVFVVSVFLFACFQSLHQTG